MENNDNEFITRKSAIFIQVIIAVYFISAIFIHFIFDIIEEKFVLSQNSTYYNPEFVNETKETINNAKRAMLVIYFYVCAMACIFIPNSIW